jgi:homoserine kinase
MMDKKNQFIKAFAPATVSNVNCGFDVLGFAIDFPGDEVWVRKTNSDKIIISKITGPGNLSKDLDKNVVGIVIKSMAKKLNYVGGLEIELHKGYKIGSGLGSSAASSAAAVFAMNKLFDGSFTNLQLVEFALEGELFAAGSVHADNVAPSIFGGIVLIRSYSPLDIIPIKLKRSLYCTVIHPQIELSTLMARKIIKKNVALSKAIKQWGNLAGLMIGLIEGNYELIFRSMEDHIIEPQRSKLIPLFAEAKKAASDSGALGAGISGSGPSIFALSKSLKEAENIASALTNVYINSGIVTKTYVSAISDKGAHILS